MMKKERATPFFYERNHLLGTWDIFYVDKAGENTYFAGQFGSESDVKKTVELLNHCEYRPTIVWGVK